MATLCFSAPTALADPVPLIPAPAPAPADPVIPAATGPAPGPAPDGTVQSAAGTLPTPPDGMQHLSSPENLPPGTTDTPPATGGGSYLRDLWHAYQTQEISGRDALLLLSQRPMDPATAPPPAMPANPVAPPGPDVPTAPAPDPAPAPLFPWLAPPPAPTP
jgi:hypothetical protein